jgi:transcriptional regulator with XRE-family HTH domain
VTGPAHDSSGAELREAREARGWTLEFVASQLNIGVQFLQAFEDEDPDVAFPRGPFRAQWYAKYRAYLGLAEAPAPRETAPRELTVTEETGTVRVGWERALAVVVVLAAAIGGLSYLFDGDDVPTDAFVAPDMHVSIVSVESLPGVRVVLDGREAFSGELQARVREVYHAHDRIEVYVPRMEGVTFGWSQGVLDADATIPPFTPLGAQGRPRTLVFIDDEAP